MIIIYICSVHRNIGSGWWSFAGDRRYTLCFIIRMQQKMPSRLWIHCPVRPNEHLTERPWFISSFTHLYVVALNRACFHKLTSWALLRFMINKFNTVKGKQINSNGTCTVNGDMPIHWASWLQGPKRWFMMVDKLINYVQKLFIKVDDGKQNC